VWSSLTKRLNTQLLKEASTPSISWRITPKEKFVFDQSDMLFVTTRKD